MSGPWSVPRCFDGHTVAVLASGPSMSRETADQVHAARIPAIAINTTFRLAPWAWALYAADYEWWQHPQHADAKAFAGHKVTVYTGSGQPPAGLSWLMSTGSSGFDADPRHIRTGSNSGYQALHIAAQTGASRVLLCGYDMHGGHWHGEHPRGLKVNTIDAFEKFRARFAEIVKPMKQLGIDVVNVTPSSRLECFRRSTLEAELEKVTC